MKIRVLVAALGAALALPFPALAADQHSSSGHYEWRSIPQSGPRATGPTRQQVWVPDPQMANCNCDMMKMNAADCMKHMRGTSSSSSAS